MTITAGIAEAPKMSGTPKVRRSARVEKADNGYIVNLEMTGDKYQTITLVENKLKRALADVAVFMEATED